ncbi:MAG: hypothetical protein KGK03_08220 [Candidatus Omnitrophica bacterium]|nr:hypothetical protein [Candidatus Omnitrophota bacterium]MDE2223040.1 hypothetical protein [Candidatus Omnitrophota bacterium]
MGQIRKINNVYYIEFYARGLLYSQPGGRTLAEAQKLLAQVEEKIAGGEALTISRHIDLPDFFERFTAAAQKQFSAKTFMRFKVVIGHFSGYLEREFPQIHQLAQVTPAVIESYKVHLAKSQRVKAANFTILLIKDILTFGITLGFLNDNPCTYVQLLAWPSGPIKKRTQRYLLAKRLLNQGVGLAKLTQLLNLDDIARTIYFAPLADASFSPPFSL